MNPWVKQGILIGFRMGEIVDGQYQKYAVESGAYVREHFWGVDPRLLDMVKHLSDDQLKKMTLGGHDPVKVYNAYKAAVEHKDAHKAGGVGLKVGCKQRRAIGIFRHREAGAIEQLFNRELFLLFSQQMQIESNQQRARLRQAHHGCRQ